MYSSDVTLPRERHALGLTFQSLQEPGLLQGPWELEDDVVHVQRALRRRTPQHLPAHTDNTRLQIIYLATTLAVQITNNIFPIATFDNDGEAPLSPNMSTNLY